MLNDSVPMKIVLPFFLFVLFAVPVSAELELAVQLDRTAVYEGETFFYQLVLTDSKPISSIAEPDTSLWHDFDVQFLPKQTEQRGGMKSVVILNGKVVKDDQSATSYVIRFNYILSPKHRGINSIPLPKVTVNGQTLLPKSFAVDDGDRQLAADGSVSVRIIEPERQDSVILTIETNRNRCYPLQPLEITLVVQIKALPGRFAGTDPLLLLRQPPQLKIPWAVSDHFSKGILGEQKLENWLASLLVVPPQKGFSINGLSNGLNASPMNFGFFDDMFQKVLYQFSGSPKKIKRPDGQGNESAYWEYRFSRRFIPQEFGNYSFGPVTLKGTLPVAEANAPDGVGAKKFYAAAQAVNVNVADIPQEKRPADYIGAFGTFRWNVNIEPREARIGDPMTLTLRLSGQGSMANVRPVDLTAIPAIAENFRVHLPPTEEMNETSCSFTYTIRPQMPGKIVFPPISVSVFDVNTEQFSTLQSAAIPLEIAEAENVQSATLFGSVSADSDALRLSEKGLFANKTAPEGILPMIGYKQWAAVLSFLTAAYIIAAISVSLLRNRRIDSKAARKRGALSRAKSRLASITVPEELQAVFFGYTADVSDGAEQGMTTSDVCRLLREGHVSETLIAEIQKLLDTLDAAKYGGMNVRSLDELTQTAAAMLQRL
jgi:hypothetical protein